MKRYLDVCKFAVEKKLINSVMGGRRYMIEGSEFYSIYDLVCVENCSLEEYLKSVIVTFKKRFLNLFTSDLFKSLCIESRIDMNLLAPSHIVFALSFEPFHLNLISFCHVRHQLLIIEMFFSWKNSLEIS